LLISLPHFHEIIGKIKNGKGSREQPGDTFAVVRDNMLLYTKNKNGNEDAESICDIIAVSTLVFYAHISLLSIYFFTNSRMLFC